MIVIGGGRKFCRMATLDALRTQVTRERWLIVEIGDPHAAVTDPAADVLRRDGGRVTLRFDPTTVDTATLIGRVTAAHNVRDLFVQNPPIEEIIARLYGQQSQADA